MVLYVSIVTLVQIPSTQKEIGNQLADALGNELNTEVHVGNVSLGFLNRLIIDDVLIRDQQQQEMLRIGRLSAKISLLALVSGRIDISSIQMFNARAMLIKPDADTPANYQFIIDTFASNDTTSHTPLDLHINSIIIRHSSVSYDQLDAPAQEQFCPQHLRISDISAHIILKELTDDSLNVNVKRLALKEKSGLDIRNFAFKLMMGNHNALLSDFTLALPHSTLDIDSVGATYQRERIKETLSYGVKNIQGDVTISDLGCIIPALKNYDHNMEWNIQAEGTTTSLKLPVLTINASDDALTLKMHGWANRLDLQYPEWALFTDHLSISADAIRILQKEIKGIPEFVNNLNGITITGQQEGTSDGRMKFINDIKTPSSLVRTEIDYNSDRTFTARVRTNDLDLRQILPDKQLGLVDMNTFVKGNPQTVNIQSDIAELEFRGYNYHNIAINAKYKTDDLFKGNSWLAQANGSIEVNDTHAKAFIDGKWYKTGKKMTMQLDGTVDRIAPQELNLSDKWGAAVFAGQFHSDLQASNLNNAEGTVVLDNFSMSDSTESYHIQHVELASGTENERHFLKMKGDMGDAELTGQFDWETLPQSFINYVASRLPTLPGLPPTNKSATNNFSINISMNSTQWLKRIVGIDFLLNRPMKLQANINDLTQDFHVVGMLPSFSYNGEEYKDAVIQLDTPQDSIICNIDLKKVMDDQTDMNLSMQANAFDNQLQTTFVWDNTGGEQALKGELNAITQLYSDDNGAPEAHVHIQPSHLVMGDAKWNVIPCDIFYSEKNLTVEDFSIEHNKQHLTISGIASDQPTDTLNIDLKGIDVGYVLDLVNFHSVEFNGRATGRAYATELFGTPSAAADLIVEQFTFEGGRMGTLGAHASWNNEQDQIDIQAIANDGADALTYIKGYVSPIRSDIKLDIKGEGTYVDFVQNYTQSFLSNVTGHAYGSLQLVGPLGEMDLLGDLVVDATATVIPLGTTYTMQRDSVKFIRNDIIVNNVPILDRDGNKAELSGGIHHDHLSSLTFDLSVKTEKFLAYDIPDFGNELFCGKVYASGAVELRGRPGEVVINCDATPLRQTVFFYNASSADAVSYQDFITWGEKAPDTLTISDKNTISQENAQASIPTDIYINFLVNTTPQATLRLLMDQKTGDYITLNGSGVLRASYHNKGAFMMYGTYSVDHGTYGITIQNIIKKNFQFKEGGTIVFGGNPMNASLQLQAIHTVNGVSLSDLNIGNSFANNTIRVNCLMNIQGQAGTPRVEFDLDMPTVNSEEKQMIRSIITSEQEMNQQVLYLLGVGRFYTQGLNNSEVNQQEYDQTQLAMQSFLSGTLSSQINQVISHVVKNDNWNFGANISTGNEGWNNAEYEGLVSGSLFNNRLLINGQFGYRDNARQESPSFIGDFDIRYLLQPNGNLALKVYNQTNDRYFTRSSLNTQGIGIIVKRDFANLGELLFRHKK